MNSAAHLETPVGEEEDRILHEALLALRKVTGLSLGFSLHSADPQPRTRRHAERLATLSHGGEDRTYQVQIRAVVDRVGQLALIQSRRPSHTPWPVLLVTPYLSDAMIQECRVQGLQFVDCAGNTYLSGPGLYVFVRGQPKPPPDLLAQLRPAPSGGTASASRVIFSLLLQPDLLRGTYRKLAEQSGVSLGSIGRVLDDLRARGHIIGPKEQPRFSARMDLVDEWSTTYPMLLRPKLHPRRFHADAPLVELKWASPFAAWGGEVAADRLVHNLKPVRWTLYVNPENRVGITRELASLAKLRANPAGNLEIIDAFWKMDPTSRTVPALLIYADLVASRDPRNLEVAQEIYGRFLASVDA